MRTNTGNLFQSFILDEVEDEHGRTASPYFHAYLQNKIASVAQSAVEFAYVPGTDLHSLVIQHERIKAQVEILQELLSELKVPTEDADQQQSGASHS
jgi:hypothetical protein